MRAYRIAGLPAPELPAVGSFPQWQRHVRDLVFWLFEYDLSEQFEKNKEDDPERQNDAALLAALYGRYETGAFKAARLLEGQLEEDYPQLPALPAVRTKRAARNINKIGRHRTVTLRRSDPKPVW
jgi:hypothetical protein